LGTAGEKRGKGGSRGRAEEGNVKNGKKGKFGNATGRLLICRCYEKTCFSKFYAAIFICCATGAGKLKKKKKKRKYA
jgi:hypothetical protein